MTTNVFLYFDEDCEEAFELYRSVFGGEFTSIGRYGDMPAREGMPDVPEDEKRKIMHVQLPISGETWLRGADNLKQHAGNKTVGSGFSIVVTADSEEKARRVFDGLSAGGQVNVPMAKQFWGDFMGVFSDKFGIGWIVNYTPEGKKYAVMAKLQKIVPNLWFDDRAEEAAKLYTSIFPNSKIGRVVRYTKAGFETHRMPEGSVMTVEFSLSGQDFIALNGGPVFRFNEAVSLMITCDSQQEIDYYWEKLTENGGEQGPCGWCKDRFGLSWQVAPAVLQQMLSDPDTAKVERVTEAYLKMKKFDIEQLKRAFEGK